MGKPVFPPCCLTWGQTGGGNENNGHLLQKVPCTHFSNNHVRMWELDHKESSVWKNWCFWTVVLEKTLERPLDCKEIKPIQPKGNQSWLFIGRTNAEVETPIFWPPDATNWLIWKDPVAGKDWRQEENGTTGWDVWMASPTQWTWVWVNSGSWWWTGRPGVLWFMGSQRIRHDWVTELNWIISKICISLIINKYQGFPSSSASKESACNAENSSLIPGSGRSPEEGKSYPLQYSGLVNSTDYTYSPQGCKELDMTERLSLFLVWGLFQWVASSHQVAKVLEL